MVLLLLLLSFPRGGGWFFGASQASSRPVESRTLSRGAVLPATAARTSGVPHRLAPSPGRAATAKPSPTPLPAPDAARGKPTAFDAIRLVGGAEQLALVNADRALHGEKPLRWDSCLVSVALANAQRSAALGVPAHAGGVAADLGCGLSNSAAENLGSWSGGVDDTRLNAMFMASAPHRANILNPAFSFVGIAWAVTPRGFAYIAEEFS